MQTWWFLSVLIFSVIGFKQVDGQSITVPPSDVTTRVSSTVVLRCEVADQIGDLLWQQSDKTISTNDVINAEFEAKGFSITGDQTLGQYYLRIESVTMDDMATYTCAVTGPPQQSAAASLTVLEAIPPNTGNPQCAEQVNDLSVEKEIILICSSEGGDPPATLVWSNGAQDLEGVDLETQVGVRLGLPLTFGPAIQGKTYTCTSNHVTYTQPQTCTIGPLDINQQSFVSIPPLRSERQSDHITLECVTRDKSGQLEWYKDTSTGLLKLSSDTDVLESFGGRFSITGDQLLGQYTLSIDDLQYSDAGDYLCHLTAQGVQPSVWSQYCKLTVEDPIPPGENYPVCEIPPPPYLEGHDITFMCRSQGGYPSAKLVWSSDGVELPSEILESGSGSTRVALNLILDHSHEGSALVCTSSYQNKSCQVEPFDIDLLTRVLVELTPEILEMEEGDSASLVCDASVTEGAPPITSYEWSYENQKINISDKRFSRETLSMTSSTLFILSAEKNMDDAKIVCVAKSDVDAQMATASIRIVEATLFGLSYLFLAIVVALVIAIVVALIIIGIIIYCVWKKRQQKEEEEEKRITRTIEESTVSANVSGDSYGEQPYSIDDKYDYFVIFNSGKHSRSGKHRHSSKGKHNSVVPHSDTAQFLNRSLPPIPVPPPYYQDDEHEEHKRRRRRRRRRRHRRHSDDEHDDGDRHRHSRRSRSESRSKEDRGHDDDYAKPKKRRSRRRDRNGDKTRSRSEPPRPFTDSE
ncbi:CD276 antigen-like [Glandiceps talaboti]